MALGLFVRKGNQYLAHAPWALMHARHFLGMLATVRFQNSFEFSCTLRSQAVPLNIVPSIHTLHMVLSSTGVCSTSNVPSVSSINRILRNRAAERAAVEYTKIASRSMLNLYPQLWRLQQPHDYTYRIQLPEPPTPKDLDRYSRSESPLPG